MAHYLSEGTLLHAGSYRIVRFISSGGFGCTYEAIHLLLEDRVAIKEFFVQDLCERSETTSQIVVGLRNKQALVEKLRRKFIDEARGLRKLQHKGIVSVSDVFEENGTAYFVMDYVEGQSLSDRLKASGPLPEEEALKYIRQVCDALAYVHANNRLHLDIKPGNIMIDGDDRAILIDFGASKQYDEVDGENTSTLMGKTPGYAPPEQMSNNVVKFFPSTDIYALGATLYKLLTGITPPDALQRISGEPVALLPEEISTATRRAVEAALLLDKTARPQTIAAFLKLLDSKAKPAAVATPSAPAEEKTQFGPQQEEEAEQTEQTEQTELPMEELIEVPIEITIPTEPAAPATQPKKKSQPRLPRSSLIAILIAAGLIITLMIVVSVCRELNLFDDSTYHTDYHDRNKGSDLQSGRDAAQNAPQRQQQTIDIPMVYVAGGTFTMGASDNDSEAYSNEKPAHRVTVSSFYIGKYEVTQAQWKAVMGSNPSRFNGDNLPVEQVDWDDVQEFIRKLNAQTGKTYRLPTEAEWEFAARGGNSSRGYKYSGSNDLNSVAWYHDNSGEKTHPVGTKQPNELGIYDMAGNVWEWCSDWYDSSYYSSAAQTNPKGPTSGSSRVLRGGSWDFSAWDCRVSYRAWYPDYWTPDYGIRLVLDAQ